MNYAQIRWSVENEPRAADTTRDRLVHTPIKLARLIRKAKEREKYKSARDQQPAEHLEAVSHTRVIPPDEARDLDNLGIVAVRGGPTLPRCDTFLRSNDNDIRPQWNGSENSGGRNAHQPEVPATAETLGMRHHLLELTLALVERANGRDWN
jgi:hypothetical protein